MGMFDSIRSSYDLGPGFWDKELQTKDLSSTMSYYWINPAGQLFLIDYSHTVDYVPDPEDSTMPFRRMKSYWKPNGNHGKVQPVFLTNTIKVYPARWDSKYAPFPTLKITFIDGVLRT